MNDFLVRSEFVINPNGKSEVCILHEYMQRVLKVRPVYNFFECGKSAQNTRAHSYTSHTSTDTHRLLVLIRVDANK